MSLFLLHDVALEFGLDVNLPSTVLSGLIQNGMYQDLYYSNNIDTVSVEQFDSSWWYVKDFVIDDLNDLDYYSIAFEGINYKANIGLMET